MDQPNNEQPELQLPFIARSEKTERLYQLEEARQVAIAVAAKEYAKLMGYTEEEYYTRTIPEVLLSVLDSYSPSISVRVAKRFVELKEKR